MPLATSVEHGNNLQAVQLLLKKNQVTTGGNRVHYPSKLIRCSSLFLYSDDARRLQ